MPLPRIKWSLILPILTFLGGIIAGIFIPLWQEFWVQVPYLSIELNSIRKEASTSVPIVIAEHSELAFLRNWRDQFPLSLPSPRTYYERFVSDEGSERELFKRINNLPPGTLDLEILGKLIVASRA